MSAATPPPSWQPLHLGQGVTTRTHSHFLFRAPFLPLLSSFNPNSFPEGTWDENYFFGNFARSTTALKVRDVYCTDACNCCAQLYCFDPNGCNSTTVSLAFVAPASTSTACGGTNVGIGANDFSALSSCSGLGKGYTHPFPWPTPMATA